MVLGLRLAEAQPVWQKCGRTELSDTELVHLGLADGCKTQLVSEEWTRDT